MKKLLLRLSVYFAGLFVMTIGIALSVKSNLGVSPVSSISVYDDARLGN